MTSQIKLVAPLLVVAALTACDRLSSLPTQRANYQMIAAQNEVYRLDTSTGRVAKVDSNGVKPLAESPTPVAIDGLYKLETGETVKYLGAGKFGPAVTVSNW